MTPSLPIEDLLSSGKGTAELFGHCPDTLVSNSFAVQGFHCSNVLDGEDGFYSSLPDGVVCILPPGSKEQVVGVDAGRRVTSVENAEVFCNVSTESLPGNSVGSMPGSFDDNYSVSKVCFGSGPEPASTRACRHNDSAHEFLGDSHGWTIHPNN